MTSPICFLAFEALFSSYCTSQCHPTPLNPKMGKWEEQEVLEDSFVTSEFQICDLSLFDQFYVNLWLVLPFSLTQHLFSDIAFKTTPRMSVARAEMGTSGEPTGPVLWQSLAGKMATPWAIDYQLVNGLIERVLKKKNEEAVAWPWSTPSGPFFYSRAYSWKRATSFLDGYRWWMDVINQHLQKPRS